MIRLETLELSIEDDQYGLLQAKVTPDFQRDFENTRLILPTLKTLVFSECFEWLVYRCPNVRRIVTKDGWLGETKINGLFKTVETVKDLEHFRITL
jgi:hypothetical protein